MTTSYAAVLLVLYYSAAIVVVHANVEFQQVGGKPIKKKEYKYFAAIRNVVDDSYDCSGFLLGSRFVGTASHCVKNKNSHKVQVGYLCQRLDNCGRASQVIRVQRIHRHPQDGDMILLELAEDVRLRKVLPVIPDVLVGGKSSLVPALGKGDKMTMVSAGRTGTVGELSETVEKMTVKFLSPKKCRKKINPKFITDTVFCSTPPKNASPCRGDSGAALVVKAPKDANGPFADRDVVVGVHSFGPNNCSNPKTRFGGHFRMRDATDLLRFVVCEGPYPEDWCRLFSSEQEEKSQGNGDDAQEPPQEQDVPVISVLRGSFVRSINDYGHWSETIDYSPDGERLVIGDGEGRVRIYDSKSSGVALFTLEHNNQFAGQVTAVQYNPADKNVIASGSKNDVIRLWDTTTAETTEDALSMEWTDHEGDILALSWSSTGLVLASTSYVNFSFDQTIRLWTASTGLPLRTLSGHGTSPVQTLSFSPDGVHLASGDWNGHLKVWNTANGRNVWNADAHTLGGSAFRFIHSVSYNLDGSMIASGASDATIKIWNATTGTLVQVLAAEEAVTGTAWSPHWSHILASTSLDDTVRLWNGRTGTLLDTLEGHDGDVHDVVWNPVDPSELASVGQEIIVWKVTKE